MANLFEAVKNNDLDRVRILVESGSSILEKDKDGWTALHYASRWGHLEIAKLLVESYAAANANTNTNISEKDYSGWTPLHYASKMGHLEIVKLLIEFGMSNENTNVSEKDEFGRTALHFASIMGHFEIVKLLVDKSGSSVFDEDDYGRTALHWATFNNRFDIVKFLVESGSNIDVVSETGRFALCPCRIEIKYFLMEQLEIQQNGCCILK